MICIENNGILAECDLLPAPLCGFWKNLGGHFARFACNHSDGYAVQRIEQNDLAEISPTSRLLMKRSG